MRISIWIGNNDIVSSSIVRWLCCAVHNVIWWWWCARKWEKQKDSALAVVILMYSDRYGRIWMCGACLLCRCNAISTFPAVRCAYAVRARWSDSVLFRFLVFGWSEKFIGYRLMESEWHAYEARIERDIKYAIVPMESCKEKSAYGVAFIDEVGKMLSINERLVPNGKNFVMHELFHSLSFFLSFSRFLRFSLEHFNCVYVCARL